MAMKMINFEAAPPILPITKNLIRSRYELAIPYVRDKRVLDVGCGFGHGTNNVAKYTKSIVGVEPNKIYYEFASKFHKKNNLSYINKAFEELDKSEVFDIILAFEVIEHIEEDALFVSMCRDKLKDGGVVILTTPNKDFSNVFLGGKLTSPYHKREYSKSQLINIFNKAGFNLLKTYYSRELNNNDKVGFAKLLKTLNSGSLKFKEFISS